MTPENPAAAATEDPGTASLEPPAPAAVMCFNASEPSGAGGLAGDVASAAAMGAHALPIVTSIVMRDTADIFDQHDIDADVVVEQARTILEDITIAAWKVGFLGSPDNVSAVAEVLSDYTEIPLVTHLPNLSWMDEDLLQPYLDAFRELILPATEVLVGNHKTLQDFLLPEWDSERPPSARELAVAAAEHGTRYVLVTGVALASKGPEQYIDNVLASQQGALAGEKFERFETSFVGAGDTLSAALAALLATGVELQPAVSEALNFLDQSLDAGFRPGMGHVVPDRFFWALPPPEGEEGDGDGSGEPGAGDEPEPESPPPKAHRAACIDPGPTPGPSIPRTRSSCRSPCPRPTRPCSSARSASFPAA
ncbi:MAG: hydroxymethylpyrimidine/phosphomethylpyrimidine kinase [Rubrivivax sp.]